MIIVRCLFYSVYCTALLVTYLHAGFMLACSSTLKMEVTYPSETSLLTVNVLHGFISQKTELFITAGVRTSNPTQCLDRKAHNLFNKLSY
jgi:hypothetical protein